GSGTRIRLGPYGEELRRFLVGKGPFPQKVVLTIGVIPPKDAIFGFNLPYLKSSDPHFSYLQYLPGMIFVLTVGGQLTESDKKGCFYSDPLHPILLSDKLAAMVLGHIVANSKKAIPSDEVRELYRKKGGLP